MLEEREEELSLRGTARSVVEVLMDECLETIKAYDLLNFGTKILLMELATVLHWDELAQTFDKIFCPDIAHKHLALMNIEFIKAIKLIHDLFFNEEIKLTGDYGIKTAINYYLPGCGAIDLKKLQFTIKNILNTEIERLKTQHKKASSQSQQWLLTKDTLASSNGWVELIPLTLEQKRTREHPEYSKFFFNFNRKLPGVLTPRQHLFLPKGLEPVLLSNSITVKRLRSMYDFENIGMLNAKELDELLVFAPQIAILAGQVIPSSWPIRFDELRCVVSFNELIDLQPSHRLEILQCASAVTFLMIKIQDLQINDLFVINDTLRKEILRNPIDIVDFLSIYPSDEEHYLFKKIVPLLEVLSIEQLEEVRQHPLFTTMINYNEEFLFVLKNKWFTFPELSNRTNVVENKGAIQAILEREQITFAVLQISFTDAFLQFFYGKAPSMLSLLNEHDLTLKDLSRISLQNLEKILEDPSSTESQAILHPISTVTLSIFRPRPFIVEESPAKKTRFEI